MGSWKFSALTLATLAGCTTTSADIPAGADKVAEGNKTLAWQAPGDGIICIDDEAANRLTHTGAVRRRQTISIDSTKDDIPN
jgi:hypothetical protein